MVRSSMLVVLSLSTLFFTACSPQESSDAEGEQGSAQTASARDLLTICPALEGVELVASVVGDADVIVKQEYTLASFGPDGRQVGRRVTTAQTPSTNHRLRFYRDAQGRSKFQLEIGTWAGMDESIDGSIKRATVSGTVTNDDASFTYGKLAFTSRRDNFKALAGDRAELSFEQLDCQGGAAISVTLPILTLEKTGDELVDVQDGAGRTHRVTPKVRWEKKLDSATLQFHAVQG